MEKLSKNLRALILAGGKQTRMESVTQNKSPKSFVILDEKSQKRGIDYVAEMLASVPIEDVVVSANDYLPFFKEIGKVPYQLTYQRKEANTGGAVFDAIQEYGTEKQYLVMSPDCFVFPDDLARLVLEHKEGTISWGVSRKSTHSMEEYNGLIIDKETHAVLGDVKLPWTKKIPDNTELVVKGAVQLIDPKLYLKLFAMHKRLCNKIERVDLYYDICPMSEE